MGNIWGIKICTVVLENAPGVREEEPPTRQRGASAAGHTPLRTL